VKATVSCLASRLIAAQHFALRSAPTLKNNFLIQGHHGLIAGKKSLNPLLIVPKKCKIGIKELPDGIYIIVGLQLNTPIHMFLCGKKRTTLVNIFKAVATRVDDKSR
jgi:hypothetical protein